MSDRDLRWGGPLWQDPLVIRMLADFPFPEEDAALVVDAQRNLCGLALRSVVMGISPTEMLIDAKDYR
jgi:hypothetical protein